MQYVSSFVQLRCVRTRSTNLFPPNPFSFYQIRIFRWTKRKLLAAAAPYLPRSLSLSRDLAACAATRCRPPQRRQSPAVVPASRSLSPGFRHKPITRSSPIPAKRRSRLSSPCPPSSSSSPCPSSSSGDPLLRSVKEIVWNHNEDGCRRQRNQPGTKMGTGDQTKQQGTTTGTSDQANRSKSTRHQYGHQRPSQ